METFPVIDITGAINKYNKELYNAESEECITDISNEVLKAFTEWGFIYLRGHGISPSCIDKHFKIFREFFHLPVEQKNKAIIKTDDSKEMMGYVPFASEKFIALEPSDLKEALEYKPYMTEDVRMKLKPELLSTFEELYSKCETLTKVLLKLLNIALEIDDENFMLNAHKNIGKVGNVTIIRSLYYPPVLSSKVNGLQTRCSEHTDYGTLTLLFQDNTGGLEVQSPNGEFINVVPIPGTIIVNAADLLERWTSGRVKSSRHRVVLPKNTSKAKQSIAFFCQPDNDFIVKCLDGSDKYEPVSSYDYINSRFKEVLNYE